MLGLGLGSHKASALRSLAAKLLAKLKERSTYHENNQASKDTIQEIANYNLLDKATILLTPTATSDARVHSVKTYIGDEIVTNGTFDTDSDWSKGTGWSISGGKARRGGHSVNSDIRQDVPVVNGGTYKFSYTRAYESGNGQTNLYIKLDNVNYSTIGSYNSTVVEEHTVEGYFTTTFTGNLTYRVFGIGDFTGTIDNVSIIDVSSDFDFDRASSATRINSSGLLQDMQSITDPELVLNGDFEELSDNYIINPTFDISIPFGTNGSGWVTIDTSSDNGTIEFFNGGIRMQRIGSNLKRLRAVLSGGSQAVIPSTVETYKIQYEVISATDDNSLSNVYLGGASVQVGSSSTTVGVHTVYGESGGSNGIIQFQPLNNKEVVLDNISVQQVDPNDRWDIYESGSSTVTFTDVASINIDGSNSNAGLYQENVFENNKTYEIVLTMKATATFDAEILETQGAATETTIGDVNLTTSYQDFIFYFTATGTNDLFIHRKFGQTDGQNQQILISNVSVKDVTFSTDVDLARINYDSNGDNGHILLEPTRTNDANYSQNATEWVWGKDSNANNTTRVDSQVDPYGGTSASQFTRNSGTSGWFANANSTTGSAVDFTHSIFVKQPASNASDTINMKNVSTSPQSQVTFTFSSESFTTESNATGSFEKLANGYYRLSMTFANGSASTAQVRHTLDDGEALIVFGIQHEEGSYPTSYIPNLTTGQTTRAVETLLGSGNSTLINSTEGVLYAEIALLSENDKSSNNQLFLNDGTSLQRVGFYTDGNGDIKVQLRDVGVINNVTALDQSETGVNVAAFNKIAIQYKSGENKLFVNGSRITDTNFDNMTFDLSTLSELDFGSGANSNYFRGKCKALAVFNEALSDSELTNLTS